jgi:hypothetical protein
MKVKIVDPKSIGMLDRHKGAVYDAHRLDDGGVQLDDKAVSYVRVARHNVGEGRPVQEVLDQQFDWANGGGWVLPIPYKPGVP